MIIMIRYKICPCKHAGKHVFFLQQYAGLGELLPLQHKWLRALTQLVLWLCRPTPAAIWLSHRDFHSTAYAALPLRLWKITSTAIDRRFQIAGGYFFIMFSEQQSVWASLKRLKRQYYKGHWKFKQLFESAVSLVFWTSSLMIHRTL